MLRGRDFEKALKRLYDPMSKKLTQEAVDACQITGINPEDLNEKTLEHFRQTSENVEIAEMRYQHYEKRRKDKAAIVLAQANEIVYRKNQVIASQGGW